MTSISNNVRVTDSARRRVHSILVTDAENDAQQKPLLVSSTSLSSSPSASLCDDVVASPLTIKSIRSLQPQSHVDVAAAAVIPVAAVAAAPVVTLASSSVQPDSNCSGNTAADATVEVAALIKESSAASSNLSNFSAAAAFALPSAAAATVKPIKSKLSAKAIPFDPELDSSRDGLPLLFKSARMGSVLESVQETLVMMAPLAAVAASSDAPMSGGPARSSSLTGNKRKEASPATSCEDAQPHSQSSTVFVSQLQFTSSVKVRKPGSYMTMSVPVAVAKSENEMTHRTRHASALKRQKLTTEGASKTTATASVSFAPVVHCSATDGSSSAAHLSHPSSLPAAASVAGGSETAGAAPVIEDAATLAQRLRQRQKQLDLGKRTPGYVRYLALKQKRERDSSDPRTPNIHKKCSKRSWDGQVKLWRRKLHLYDDVATSSTGSLPSVNSSDPSNNEDEEMSASSAEEAEEDAPSTPAS